MSRPVGINALGHPHDCAMALNRGYVPGGVRAEDVWAGERWGAGGAEALRSALASHLSLVPTVLHVHPNALQRRVRRRASIGFDYSTA